MSVWYTKSESDHIYIFFLFKQSGAFLECKKKGKAIPVTDREGP
jgi:hypothetical protein